MGLGHVLTMSRNLSCNPVRCNCQRADSDINQFWVRVPSGLVFQSVPVYLSVVLSILRRPMAHGHPKHVTLMAVADHVHLPFL